MNRSVYRHPGLMLAVGLIIGVILGMTLPHSPAHAVATDRHDNFAICTVPIESQLEAVCVLDFVTGQLKSYVLSPQRAAFTAYYERQIAADFGVAVGRKPQFLMVSGLNNVNARPPALPRKLQAVLYIAELNSGKIIAYGLPFAPNIVQANGRIKVQLLKMHDVQFRQDIIRNQGGNVGNGN